MCPILGKIQHLILGTKTFIALIESNFLKQLLEILSLR